MRRLWFLLVAAVLLLTSCSAAGMSGEDSASFTEAESAPAPERLGDGALGESAADEQSAVVDIDRDVITTGSVSMTVDDPRATARETARLVEHVGGFVQERSEQSAHDGESGNAYLVVRIPAAEVTSVLARLEELGEVQGINQTSDDVTTQGQDLDARIRALQLSVTRLEALLERSGSVAQVVEAEQVLTDRQADLEALQSQRARLAEQVAMSTFHVDLWTTDAVPVEQRGGFLSGLLTGWNGLMATLHGLLTVLGVLLPWLAFAGIVVLVVLAARRGLGPRQAATTLPAAPSGAEETATAPAAAEPSQPVAPEAVPATSAPTKAAKGRRGPRTTLRPTLPPEPPSAATPTTPGMSPSTDAPPPAED